MAPSFQQLQAWVAANPCPGPGLRNERVQVIRPRESLLSMVQEGLFFTQSLASVTLLHTHVWLGVLGSREGEET